MRYRSLLTIYFFLASACGATQKTNDRESGQSDCKQLAELAATAAAIKWAIKKSPELQQESDDTGWRMIGSSLDEDFNAMGFSEEEAKEFAKRIYFNTIFDSPDRDMLSHRMYAEISCKIKKEGGDARPLEEAASSLKECWRKDHKLESEACFEKVIRKELIETGGTELSSQ